MNIEKPKVLLFSTIRTTFIEDDFRLLERLSDVKWVCSSGFFAILKIKWAMLSRNVGVAWFASVYSAVMVFVARLFGKESIIIVGGADVTTDQLLEYGLLLSNWKRVFIRYAIRNATKVLPTSEFLREESLKVGEHNGDNLIVTYPGLDTDFWEFGKKREKLVLSVANCDTAKRLSIKGIDLILEVAEQMNNVTFKIVGVTSQILAASGMSIPRNVHIQSFIHRDLLLAEYKKASVYLQLSRVESFGIATAEAMICGCIPIVSNVGGLPETVGSTGGVVSSENINAVVNIVNRFLDKTSESERKACSQKAKERFSIKLREEHFQRLLKL